MWKLSFKIKGTRNESNRTKRKIDILYDMIKEHILIMLCDDSQQCTCTFFNTKSSHYPSLYSILMLMPMMGFNNTKYILYRTIYFCATIHFQCSLFTVHAFIESFFISASWFWSGLSFELKWTHEHRISHMQHSMCCSIFMRKRKTRKNEILERRKGERSKNCYLW